MTEHERVEDVLAELVDIPDRIEAALERERAENKPMPTLLLLRTRTTELGDIRAAVRRVANGIAGLAENPLTDARVAFHLRQDAAELRRALVDK